MWQPWLISLTGVVLLGLAVLSDVRARRGEVLCILFAVLGCLIAVAISRPLHLGVQFYESRYFAIVAGFPMCLLPLGLIGRSRPVAMGLMLPVALACGVQIRSGRAALARQTEDTFVLHTALARHIASELPSDAVVAVEGAGAPRFFAPRTMEIIDLVGLNDRAAAHLHFDRERKLCHFVRREPTHMAVPSHWVADFAATFDLRPIAVFSDPQYTQVMPPRPMQVVLFEVGSVTPLWRTRCAGS